MSDVVDLNKEHERIAICSACGCNEFKIYSPNEDPYVECADCGVEISTIHVQCDPVKGIMDGEVVPFERKDT